MRTCACRRTMRRCTYSPGRPVRRGPQRGPEKVSKATLVSPIASHECRLDGVVDKVDARDEICSAVYVVCVGARGSTERSPTASRRRHGG